MFKRTCTVLVLLTAANAGSLAADIIDGEELVDPTRPVFKEPSMGVGQDNNAADMLNNVLPSGFDLSFIRTGGNSTMAVINNQQVKVGDSIGGAQVVAIERNSVTLSINDQERRINLYGTDVKAVQGTVEAPR